MTNILIVEKDAKYCIKLLNDISTRNTNIKVGAIANTLENMYKHATTQKFDIILINLNLLIAEKIKQTTKNFITKNKKSIIILTDTSKNLKQNSDFIYILKNDINSILDKILEMSSNKIEYNMIKNKIARELRYLGYNPAHVGTTYISEIIYIIYHTNYEGSLENRIYPYLAKKYNKTENTIKCNIINATNLMVCECEEKKLMNYLGKCDFFKPGPKTIIYAIINKISH